MVKNPFATQLTSHHLLAASITIITLKLTLALNLNDALLDFSSQFFKEISEHEKNLVMAPPALHSSHNMLVTGSDKECDASKVSGKFLGFEDVSDDLHPAQKQYDKLLAKYDNMGDNNNHNCN